MMREMYFSWQRSPDDDLEVLRERELTERCELLIKEGNKNNLKNFLSELLEIEPCCSEGANLKIVDLISRVEIVLSNLQPLAKGKPSSLP